MREWKSNTLKTCENILMKEASILAKNQSFKFQTIFHLKKKLTPRDYLCFENYKTWDGFQLNNRSFSE